MSTTQVITEVPFFKATRGQKPFLSGHSGARASERTRNPEANAGHAPGFRVPAFGRPRNDGEQSELCCETLHHCVQSTAVDLAIRVARNVRDIDEPYGNMRLREPLAAVLLQGLLVQSAVRHDECPDLLDAEPIRHAERCRIADAIKRPERIFDRPRADLVAAEIQDLFLA